MCFGRSRYGIQLLSYVNKNVHHILRRRFSIVQYVARQHLRGWLKFMLHVLIISSQGAKDTEYLNTVFFFFT